MSGMYAVPGMVSSSMQPTQNYMYPLPTSTSSFPETPMEDANESQANHGQSKRRRRRGGKGAKKLAANSGAASGELRPVDFQSEAVKVQLDKKRFQGADSFIASSTGVDVVAGLEKSWGKAVHNEIDCQFCDQLMSALDSSASEAHSVVSWLLPAAKAFALSENGCRVIQKAIDIASSSEQTLLVKELRGSIEDLYKSPWGNHVVMKLIVVMPPTSLAFLVTELAGKAVVAARHQYGCRIFERLIEHFPADHIVGLIDEILREAEPLCRHRFGNFVMQHLLEFGSESWKHLIAERILSSLPQLAKHRTASHVVQRALEFCSEPVQRVLASALINAEGHDSLVAVACTRYGSYVVHELAKTPGKEAAKKVLEENVSVLALDQYGKRSLAGFGLKDAGLDREEVVV